MNQTAKRCLISVEHAAEARGLLFERRQLGKRVIEVPAVASPSDCQLLLPCAKSLTRLGVEGSENFVELNRRFDVALRQRSIVGNERAAWIAGSQL